MTGKGQKSFTARRVFLFVFCLLSFIRLSHAQTLYTDHVYRDNIKTVQFYNSGKEGSFPIITLGAGEQLLLAFDELGSNSRNYSYTIEHCDAEWNSSRLSPTEYLQSFIEDRLLNYNYSINTLQKYVHYELTLPNQNIIPKLPGNYLLKVYEDGNADKPIITRRFYVVAQRATITSEIVQSQNVSTRLTNQKINFQLDFPGISIQNPYGDVKALLMQNGRSDMAQVNTKPTQVRGSSLVYNDISINDFPGGNEFRHVDTRSLRLNAQNIARIFRDTANTVVLLTDQKRDQDGYLQQYDNNGGFYIRNQEGRDPKTDADYAHVYFNLAAPGATGNMPVYVIGKFNDYRMDERSKMDFDASKGRYYFNTFLKQGIIDYQYATTDKSGYPDFTTFEGSHFETENDYQILIYYRPAGARWEELIGFKQINSLKR